MPRIKMIIATDVNGLDWVGVADDDFAVTVTVLELLAAPVCVPLEEAEKLVSREDSSGSY